MFIGGCDWWGEKAGMWREPLRPICSKIRRRPSGVPGSLPSTSILTPHRLRSTVYVAPFVFQSTSMPVRPLVLTASRGRGRKQARGRGCGRASGYCGVGGAGLPAPLLRAHRGFARPSRAPVSGGRKCSVLAMPARKSPQGGDPASSFLRLSPSVPDAVCTARAGYAAWPFGTGQPVRRRGERQDPPDPWVLPRGPQNFAFINLRSHPPSPSRVR